MTTTLGVAVWNEQVSTTLDFAQRLRVVTVEDGREAARRDVALGDASPAGMARRIREQGVETVLCGAVSHPLAEALARSGIRLVPYVSGDVEDVVQAYLGGRIMEPRFLQPGCWPGARRRGRRGGGCGRGARGGWKP